MSFWTTCRTVRDIQLLVCAENDARLSFVQWCVTLGDVIAAGRKTPSWRTLCRSLPVLAAAFTKAGPRPLRCKAALIRLSSRRAGSQRSDS
eukprot:scaffold257802_cov21-Prasinocladus_malaysianus.AAC.1